MSTDTNIKPKQKARIRRKSQIDLNYKQIKAFTLFQTLYSHRRNTITALNKKLNVVYNTLLSIMNNLTSNYNNNVIAQDKYVQSMIKLDEVLNMYSTLPRPLTIGVFHESVNENLTTRIHFIEYRTVELVKACGAKNCYDILNCLVGPLWNEGRRYTFRKLMKFYNTMFVPLNVKITSVPKSEMVLPDVKKYSIFTKSPLLKLHGGVLYVPIYNKQLIINGYFKRDPLNIARIGGTIYDKYSRLVKESNKLDGPSEIFKARYIEQISLRDFVSLDIRQLVSHISSGYMELERRKNEPLSSLLESFRKSKHEARIALITLLLLDDENHEYAGSFISMIEPEEITNIYRFMHWSIQKNIRQD